MNVQFFTAIFTFLNSPGGQAVVSAGGQLIAEAIGGLVSLAHKHAQATSQSPATPVMEAPKA